MTTRLQMSGKVLHLLGDPTSSQFDTELVLGAIDSAMDAVLPWVAKPSEVTFIGDGATCIYDMPSDYYRVISIFDEDSSLYMPADLMAPAVVSNRSRIANEWREYPNGKLSFLQYIPDAKSVTVYYGAYWTKPTDFMSVLETPTWLDTAIAFYAASYCLLPKAYQASNIRQYNVQVDSGNPVQNPVKDMSEYFLTRFKFEMDLVPSRSKGIR